MGIMSRLLVLIVIIATVVRTAACQKEMIIMLEPGKAAVATISPGRHLVVFAGNMTRSTSAGIFEVHTQFRNLTISLDSNFTYDTSVTGSNIGAVQLLRRDQPQATWYLHSSLNSSVQALLYLTMLNGLDPIPGGCNLEFNLENDPNIHVAYTDYLTSLTYQWSNVGYPRDGQPADCTDSQAISRLSYDVYVHYMQEFDFSENTYFEAMKKMLSPDSVTKHAMKMETTKNTKVAKPSRVVTSNRGHGVIYTVVVKQWNPISSSSTVAAYIPVATYSCNMDDFENSCKKIDIFVTILITVGAIVGLFLCFLGHRFLKTEIFIFGFIAFTLVFSTVFAITTEMPTAGIIGVALIFGIIGGLLWFAFWWFCGIPILSVLLNGIVAGYLFSSLLFFTPFGNLSYWDTKFNYGMTFICGVLIFPVILLFFTRVLNVISCTFVGSYCTVVAIDTYLQGSLRLVILTAVRHAFVTGYLKAKVIFPFQTRDIILTVVWAVLIITGTAFQLYREKGKAPFPPCPRQRRSQNKWRRALSNDERRPLLRGSSPQSYGSDRGRRQRTMGEDTDGHPREIPTNVQSSPAELSHPGASVGSQNTPPDS